MESSSLPAPRTVPCWFGRARDRKVARWREYYEIHLIVLDPCRDDQSNRMCIPWGIFAGDAHVFACSYTDSHTGPGHFLNVHSNDPHFFSLGSHPTPAGSVQWRFPSLS